MTDKERNTLLELNRQIFQEKGNYTEEELTKIKIKYENLKDKIKKERVDEFKTMKPFKNLYDIPHIPHVDEKTYKEIIIPNLIRCGAIPKKDLINGKTYIGECRNASEAIWNGHTFVYYFNFY